MKALYINGSPCKNANTAQLLQHYGRCKKAGAEVEMVNLMTEV